MGGAGELTTDEHRWTQMGKKPVAGFEGGQPGYHVFRFSSCQVAGGVSRKCAVQSRRTERARGQSVIVEAGDRGKEQRRRRRVIGQRGWGDWKRGLVSVR